MAEIAISGLRLDVASFQIIGVKPFMAASPQIGRHIPALPKLISWSSWDAQCLCILSGLCWSCKKCKFRVVGVK